MRYLAEVGIEYKRSLSSEDAETENLSAGSHITPIRASLKSTIYDAKHHPGRISPKKFAHNRHPSSETYDSDVVIATESLIFHDNSESLGTHAFPSSSFENISSDCLNANINNNNSDVSLLRFSGAGDGPLYETGSEIGTSQSTDFMERYDADCSGVEAMEDSEGSEDVLTDMQEIACNGERWVGRLTLLLPGTVANYVTVSSGLTDLSVGGLLLPVMLSARPPLCERVPLTP